MTVESLFVAATLRDRFVAAVARDDEANAQRLTPLTPGPEDLEGQRREAWELLSAGTRWAARALDFAGVAGTDDTPICDSEAAFDRAQHLESQLWQLSQTQGFHDGVALLVDSVKQACYTGADLGPTLGGRLGAFSSPAGQLSVVEEVAPDPTDLQDVGNSLGVALRRLGELRLADSVSEAVAVLDPDGAD